MFTAYFVRFSRLKLARCAETFLDHGVIQACKRWRSDCPSNKFMRSVSNSSHVRKIYLSAPWHLKAGKTLLASVSNWNRVFAAAFRRQYGIELRLEVSWTLAEGPLKGPTAPCGSSAWVRRWWWRRFLFFLASASCLIPGVVPLKSARYTSATTFDPSIAALTGPQAEACLALSVNFGGDSL